jgi:hypothetical protein
LWGQLSIPSRLRTSVDSFEAQDKCRLSNVGRSRVRERPDGVAPLLVGGAVRTRSASDGPIRAASRNTPASFCESSLSNGFVPSVQFFRECHIVAPVKRARTHEDETPKRRNAESRNAETRGRRDEGRGDARTQRPRGTICGARSALFGFVIHFTSPQVLVLQAVIVL